MGLEEDDIYGLSTYTESTVVTSSYKVVQVAAEEEEIDIDLEDPEVADAALKIQAGFKGHQARKEIKKMKKIEIEDETIQDDESKKPIQIQMDIQAAEDEEEIDIDLEDPEVADAALKIQAGFKGHQARKEVKKMKEDQRIEDVVVITPEIQVSEMPSPEIPTIEIIDDQKSDLSEQEISVSTERTETKEDEEEIDIDLEDPEVADAALKIQAGFKGHQARKEVKAMKEAKEPTETEAVASAEPTESAETKEEEIDIDLEDPEVADAALKIQAGFKGHQARKEVKKMKEDKEGGDIDELTAPSEFTEKVETIETKEEVEEEIDIDLEDPEVADAALKIQAGFKGHQARKEVKKMKEGEPDKLVITDEKHSEIKTSDPIESSETTEPAETKQEEEIDIDLEDPEVADAALKIQAGFKGHQARKEVKKMKEEKEDGDTEEPQTDDGTAESSKKVESIEAKEEEIDIDLEDPEVADAALKIQAGFKGHQARKEVKKMKEDKEGSEVDQSANTTEETQPEPVEITEKSGADETKQEEEIDIDLEDPEVADAALKIQAGFKGHQARKEVKKMKEGKEEGVASESTDLAEKPTSDEPVASEDPTETGETIVGKEDEEIDIDLEDPEVADAALKIQAGFKGHQARKEVKKMKEDKEGGVEDESSTTDVKTPEIADSENVEVKQEEEEIDIDLEDPEVADAALKIQAGFKGHQARKEVKKLKEEKEGGEATLSEKQPSDEPVELTLKVETKEEEEEIDIDLEDPEVADAALKIQAGFKGHQARKEVKKMKECKEGVEVEESATASEEPAKPTETIETIEGKEDEEIDIDLDDPEVADAALKIQAGFKGHQARKEVKKLKEEKEGGEVEEPATVEEEPQADDVPAKSHEPAEAKEEEEIDIDLDDPEVADAALKIQAGFKGHQARKEVKKLKEGKTDEVGEVDESPSALEEPTEHTETIKAKEEEEIDIDLDDPEVADAALKIQAGFKGHQARKEVKKMKEGKEVGEADEPPSDEITAESTEKVETTETMEKEEIDIDLEDPEVADAALKIQAGFKGHQARKEVKKMKEDKEGGIEDEPSSTAEKTPLETESEPVKLKQDDEEIDIDLEDPEVADAALKIQAGFKGHQARKEVKKMKEDKEGGEHEESGTGAEQAQEELPSELVEAKQDEEEIDIDLEDPEVADAALKIQAGFKGHQARKEVKKMKEEKEGGEADESATTEEKLPSEKPAGIETTTEEDKTSNFIQFLLVSLLF